MKRKQFLARAVLFDWDGTLLNSYASDTRAYLTMFRALGVDWGVPELARHYSPNWYHVYRAARIPREKWDEADRLWTLAYAKETPPLLPGARRIVQTLGRDFDLAVVTSGNRRRVRQQLRDFELADYFSACVCSEDVPKKKPHPAPLNLADTAEDIEMARRAGVRSIGVLGPFSTAERIRAARPDTILHSIRDLPGYLRALD